MMRTAVLSKSTKVLLFFGGLALLASSIGHFVQCKSANGHKNNDPREEEAVCSSNETFGTADDESHGDLNASTCSTPLQPTNANAPDNDEVIIMQELGLRNVESFLMRPDYYSIVLMYDKVDLIHDPETFQKVREALVELASELRNDDNKFVNSNVQFGQLDIRQHADLRRIYMGSEDELMSERFFYNYDDDDIDGETAFMNTKYYPPFISSQLSIFYQQNVVDEMMVEGNDELINDELEERVQILLDWLVNTIEKTTTNGDDYEILYESRPKEEQRELREYLSSSEIDHSFPFEQYYASSLKDGGANKADADAATTDDDDDDDMIIQVDEDGDGETFFKYQSLYDPKVWDDSGNPASSRRNFGHLLLRYFSWAESYEVLWNDDRKRAADVQLNYKYFLAMMNDQVYELLVENEDILPRNRNHDDDEDEDDDDDDEIREDLDLRQYFSDMVFGFARSASALKGYVETQILDIYGHNMTSVHDMDHVDDDGNDTIELFVCIRKVMQALKNGGDDEEFQRYMSALNFGLRDILAKFHENISRFYVEYRNKKRESMDSKALDEASTEPFNLQTPDVIDMSDPANAELLSDYEEFERRYTARGKPVVLSNVKLFLPEDNMIDYIWEKCRHINVRGNLKTTNKVGHSSNTVNIGHKTFRLPESLMNEQRLASEDEDLRYRISFDQFQSLLEVIDNLYLFDYHPKKHCDQLFYDNTPYDEKQKMQIPYVIGGYDLGSRLAYQDTQEHPVLFIGLRGTNTKLHVDMNEEGFFMYLVSGRKRWMIFDDAEHPLLYERLLENSFVPDSLALNKSEKERRYFDERYPLLRHVAEQGAAYEFIQEPGQIVYLASGMAHAVENMEDSVGVSVNFVLRAGVYRSMHHLIHVNADFSQLDMMLRYLLFEQSDRDSEFAEHRDPLYTTMAEYWSQS